MNEPRLDPDDIVAGATAQGAAVIGWGQIVEAGNHDRDTAAMVSEHERLHVNLNFATSFGVLLRACAVHSPENLGTAVELCRTTHETYATYLSVWLAGPRALEVLAPFPDYVRYFELGQELAREFRDGSIAARNAVSAAARAAMQAPLPEAASGLQRGQLTVPESSRPDERFAALVDAAPEVRALLDSFPTAWLDRPIDETLEFEQVERFKEEATDLNRVLYERFADVLRSNGFPCLPWDGLQQDENVLAISRLGGAREELPTSLNLGKAKEDPLNPSHLSLRILDGERWVQRGAPSAALSLHLLDIPDHQEEGVLGPAHLIGPVPGESHVLIVVRPLQLLLSQYELHEQSRRLLVAVATEGVVTAVRRTVVVEGRSMALLAPLSGASELQRLQALDTDLGLLASVSTACLGNDAWRDYWLPALHATSDITLNCDIPLVNWLEATEAEKPSPRLRFECQGARAQYTDTPTQFLAVEFEEAGKVDSRQLVLGSPVAVTNLAFALSRSSGIEASEDRELTASSKHWTRMISRLIEEEPWFDRRGIEHLQGAEPG